MTTEETIKILEQKYWGAVQDGRLDMADVLVDALLALDNQLKKEV